MDQLTILIIVLSIIGGGYYFYDRSRKRNGLEKQGLHFLMYNNIGAKIKGLAKSIAWIDIISSIIIGIVLIVKGVDDEWYVLIGVGIGVMILGALAAWVSSWFMYGFGELIEKTAETAKNTAISKD
ncbi:MAG: hypothetical protein LBK23_11280 [Oscillospiraceae bacterium]|jgi:hypothetical protein|nr:hypothetical protein [Oscillospiraceae bacterium]